MPTQPTQEIAVRSLADPGLLLTAWEEALAAPAPARTAVLLHRAGLAPDLDSALDLDVGQCAALATALHRAVYGPEVDGLVGCPACSELLEVHVHLPAADSGTAGPPGAEPAEARVGAHAVRAPTVRDLLAAADGPGDPRTVLLTRCVRRLDGRPFDPAALTPEEEALLDEAAESLTGDADALLRTLCPTCGAEVAAAHDMGAVLWDQVDAAAPALMAEVTALSGAFGWSEQAVLAMSPFRRHAYLSLAAAP